MALSKDRRVRVLGSKNSVARMRPLQASAYFSRWAMMSSAVETSSSISATDRSRISIRCLTFSAPYFIQLSSLGLLRNWISRDLSSGLM